MSRGVEESEKIILLSPSLRLLINYSAGSIVADIDPWQ